MRNKKSFLSVWEMAVFAMLGTLMFCSKLIMEVLPNIHLIGMLTVVYTLVFRKKALVPIYINVLLTGLYGGFSFWWMPYLYIWTILWGVAMLLPKNMKKGTACVVYPVICGLHGFLYGILYAPAQAIMFGFDFRQTLLWVASGLPFDVLHGLGNLAAGLLIYPLSELLRKLSQQSRIRR